MASKPKSMNQRYEDLILIAPTIEYKQQAKELIEETQKYDANNPDKWAGYSLMQEYENYEEWLKELEKELNPETVNPGRVPAVTYFLLRKSDNRILGVINIRYYLNEYLKNYAGHIGYSIRPTERRKGYGHRQLELALEKCRELSIEKVLVTCKEGNIGSEKTIKSCGGVYEDTRFLEEDNVNIKRYWITVKNKEY